MSPPAYAPAAFSWQLISLRPRGQHAPLRRAAARHGGRLLAVSPWALHPCDDAASRDQLAAALGAEMAIFTSPAAVAAAAALVELGRPWPARMMAVGQGSARALQRAGVAQVVAPARMDSEGLLGLPALQQLSGRRVGLVTAPGGRGLIPRTLQERGATVLRADVYQRLPCTLAPARLARLRSALPELPTAIALSSGEALERLWPQLPADLRRYWQQLPVACASQRLAETARAHGFADVHVATGPLPAQLVATAAQAVSSAA